MRIAVIFMNVMLLVHFGALVLEEVVFGQGINSVIRYVLLALCPIASILHIVGILDFSEKSWPGAYFERKRLEEERRIEQIKKEKQARDSPGAQEN